MWIALYARIYSNFWPTVWFFFHVKWRELFNIVKSRVIVEISVVSVVQVAGYSVGCDVSPDGKFIISGSSDGRMLVYDYRVARMLRSLPVSGVDDVVLDVAWHPVLFSMVAAGTWNGHVVVWQ